MSWRRWLLVGYLVALLLSFLVRKAWDGPQISTQGGWQSMTLTDGATLAYRDLGQKDKPPLVLIHGSPMASGCFDPLIPHLVDDFRLVIPDLPGFGKSFARGLPDLSIEAHANYLGELIDGLDLQSVNIIGYSMGGGVGLHLEEIKPERVERMVMLASIGVQEHELLGDYLLNHVIHGLQLTVITGAQELIPHFGLLDRFMLNRNYARNFYDTDQRPLRGMLESWEKPLQIIHGDKDRLVPPSAAVEHHRIVPQSRLDWIEKGNHVALMQQPGQVAALIAQGQVSNREATQDRIIASKQPIPPNRIDQSFSGKMMVGSLLALATFASEDLSCISGGLLVASRVVNFWTATLGCLLGIFVSDIGLFLVGRWCTGLVNRFGFLRSKLESFQASSRKEWLEKNAGKLIMVSRFIPGSRVPTYVTMGASGIPLSKLTGWLLVAASIWTPILVGVSAIYGEQLLPFLEKNEAMIFPGFIAVLVVGAILLRVVASLLTWKGRRLLLSTWRRLTRWEFWPAWILYLFVVPSMIRSAIRYRSATVFTSTNPALPCGGFAIEPKLLSLNALKPSGNVPAFREVASLKQVKAFLKEEKVDYPFVLKPDEGERGRGVAIIKSEDEVKTYFKSIPDGVKIIAQKYIDGHEFGVFYYRYPEEKKGRIYAITEKVLLTITGDGKRTLEELMLADDRAVCMAPYFMKKLSAKRWDIPEKGEEVTLSPLGTHSRGAIFQDGHHLNSPELAEEIDRITKHFEGFHFGRYDLKAPSAADLEQGKGIEIIELNGVTSEATSMYDPIHSLRQGVRILRRQWEIAFEIGAANRDLGHPPVTFKELFDNYRSFQKQDKFESP